MTDPTPAHVRHALDEMAEACPGYDLALGYYEGAIEEVFSSQKLRTLIGPTGRRYRVNFARTPVDVLLERTSIANLSCPDERALAVLNQVWDDNDMTLESKDLHQSVYTFGDGYLIGWPDADLPGGVEAYAHDPRHVRVFYDPARPRVKSHAVHRWVERGTGEMGNGLGQGAWERVTIYFADGIEQWVSEHPLDKGQAVGEKGERAYIPYLTPEDIAPGVIDNPTPGIIPVFHFRNARPYGRPEHYDAYGPQDMINKLNITMMTSVDYAGFPQRYVLTDSALESAPSDAFGPPPEDTLDIDHGLGLDQNSEMQAGPGETWILSGSRVSVGQFQVATTDNFLRGTESLIKQMASVTDVPGYYFDRSGQMPSGESFRRSEAPLNKKLDDRLSILGATWHEFLDYCLTVNGVVAPDANVVWTPPEVAGDKDSWETAALQQAAGVPVEQTLRERGYGEETVSAWLTAPAAQPTDSAVQSP